ncbi:hypothetical protein NB525_09860 [Vibrio alginolyticus]|uniref:hypothetical protein n=1 Tax=Vibrio TaxID=662 RepID=UPI00215C8C4E|nr:hypothetical protein [Vibrio alginolyticus]MCR9594301.1 hypothetical protein [Vibrio alginolyticus]HDY7421705.1 hypothetical protein [Vibrio vulnificus]HDY7495327.1 hypothetical protein [Vibrio vulnificus]
MSEARTVNIRSVRTVEQLKKAGKIEDIIAHVNKVAYPFSVPETIFTFKELLPFVLTANQVISTEVTYDSEIEMFATRRSAILFCLTADPIKSTMDRLNFLGFPESFHDDPQKHQKQIKRWFNKLKSDIESQRRTDPITHRATLKIDDLKEELEYLLDIEIGSIDEDMPEPDLLHHHEGK